MGRRTSCPPERKRRLRKKPAHARPRRERCRFLFFSCQFLIPGFARDTMSRAQDCATEGRADTSWPHPKAGCRRERDPDQVYDSLSRVGNAGVPARRMMRKRRERHRSALHITRDMRRGGNFDLVWRPDDLLLSKSGLSKSKSTKTNKRMPDPVTPVFCFQSAVNHPHSANV